MSTHFTGNDYDGILLASSNELWINGAGTTVLAPAVPSFQFGGTSGNRLLVFGSVVSEDYDGITAQSSSSGNVVEVMANGTVSGDSDGIEMEGIHHQVVNRGAISGAASAGVELRGNGAGVGMGTITNFGTIFGSSDGVSVIGSGHDVVNFGEIAGGGNGVQLLSAQNCGLANSGTIQGGSIAVYVSSATGTLTQVTNSGALIGEVGFSSTLGNETLINSGVISGSVLTGEGDDEVFNTGTITSLVQIGGGNDIYRAGGAGSVLWVAGGLGNDTMVGASAADRILGDDGSDVVRGGGGDDEIAGGAASDNVRGGEGADDLSGDVGDDLLGGGAGADRANGGEGDDTVAGNDGDDELLGDVGDDALFGGSGDDTLDGGRDNDTLAGGSGADTFVVGLNGDADVVRAFERGVDTLDLSALGFASVATALAAATTVNGNAVFAFGGDDQVTVLGVTVKQIEADILV